MNTQSLSTVRSRNTGFTLVETMMVTGIVGLVSAVALPVYNDYTARAEMTEVVAGMSAVKTNITESVATTGRIPTDLVAPFGADSDTVSAVSVYRYENCPDRGGIEVEMGNSINPALQGKRMRLDYQGDGQWLCGKGSGDAVSDNLLPKACRNAVQAAPAGCGEIEVTSISVNGMTVTNNSFGDENWTAGYGTGGDSDVASNSADDTDLDSESLIDETLEWEATVASTSSDFDYSASNDSVTVSAPASSGAANDTDTNCEDSMGGANETGSSDALLTAEAGSDCTV